MKDRDEPKGRNQFSAIAAEGERSGSNATGGEGERPTLKKKRFEKGKSIRTRKKTIHPDFGGPAAWKRKAKTGPTLEKAREFWRGKGRFYLREERKPVSQIPGSSR